ncbi:MAG: HD domain-containing protein [Methanobacterium sp.]
MLSVMLRICATAHEGQYDKSGQPYFLHCLKVMRLLKTDDEELMCIALAHDLLEDTKTTIKYLQEQGFSERVISGIVAMTKQRGQSYEEYKEAIKQNTDAILVKIADLTHNSDIRRMKEVNQKDFDRVVKYRQFYNELIELAKK